MRVDYEKPHDVFDTFCAKEGSIEKIARAESNVIAQRKIGNAIKAGECWEHAGFINGYIVSREKQFKVQGGVAEIIGMSDMPHGVAQVFFLMKKNADYAEGHLPKVRQRMERIWGKRQ